VYLAGICSLFVTVGVARFSYTSLLPIMKSGLGLTEVEGGWLGTTIYLGYMLGVFTAASLNSLHQKYLLHKAFLVLSVLTSAGMALTDDLVIWAILRFFAGTCAAGGLIIASGLILKWLASAVLYGGTFIACVSLVLTMAGQFYPSNPAKFMGKMTLAYGVAQIIAPVYTGYLAQSQGNYNAGIYLSAFVMMVGALLIFRLLILENRT
jgi:MFS family permease